MDSAISLRSVTKTYRAGLVIVNALSEVNLDVASGELVVILGPSGSGKTTLLNVIGALDSPSEGSVIVGGREITGAIAARLVCLQARSRELHLPGLQPLRQPHRPGERGVCHGRNRPACQGHGSHVPRASRAEASELHTSRVRCPAASSSGLPSPEPWQPAIPFYWQTNQRVNWTSRRADRFSVCWRSWRARGRPS